MPLPVAAAFLYVGSLGFVSQMGFSRKGSWEWQGCNFSPSPALCAGWESRTEAGGIARVVDQQRGGWELLVGVPGGLSVGDRMKCTELLTW